MTEEQIRTLTERLAELREDVRTIRARVERLTWAIIALAALMGGGDALRSLLGGP